MSIQDLSMSKPKVIGIYGISGCGKTSLVNELKENLGEEEFVFYDGSTAINICFPEDLATFKLLPVDEKMYWRTKAIQNIRLICQEAGKVGIVAGHFMFWDDEQETEPEQVWTHGDKDSYTHILYLEKPVESVAQQRAGDTNKARKACSLEHLNKWQQREKQELRRHCLKAGVLFAVLPDLPRERLVCHTAELIDEFRQHTEEDNLKYAKMSLNRIFWGRAKELQTVLLIDGDRTLVPEDTSKIFWEACRLDPFLNGENPLKSIFTSREQYTHDMFQQAMLLYEEVGDEATFNALCDSAAASVEIRPEFKSLLQWTARHKHVGVMVVTAGLGRIFTEILKREGFDASVGVIGNGRVNNGFVVTDQVKADLTRHIRHHFGVRIYAFGDSPLDLDMLAQADEAIVVVGDKESRSSSMETKLCQRINQQWPSSSQLRQLLLPGGSRPLSAVECRHLEFTQQFMDEVVAPSASRPAGPKIFDATSKPAAKLLMTPMRNAAFSGPALRKAHTDVGRYLATEYVTQAVGIEVYSMQHVQNTRTDGYRLRSEERTIIMALMRGGEPMALGVSKVFPSATFLHAKSSEDVKEEHVRGFRTVILIDSVINNGTSMLGFINRIRSIHAKIHVVMIAGVVQEQAIRAGALASIMAADQNLSLIALRVSENKYTGKGGTDTGNRLFNTTHL